MANHKSAKKRIRQNEKIRLRNRDIKSSVRTAIKKVIAAANEKDFNKANELLKAAEKSLARAARKKILHANNAARRISRLTALVKKAAA